MWKRTIAWVIVCCLLFSTAVLAEEVPPVDIQVPEMTEAEESMPAAAAKEAPAENGVPETSDAKAPAEENVPTAAPEEAPAAPEEAPAESTLPELTDGRIPSEKSMPEEQPAGTSAPAEEAPQPVEAENTVEPEASCTLTVEEELPVPEELPASYPAVKAVAVKPEDGVNRLALGGVLTLSAVLSPAGAESKITWTSSNSKIAAVSADGVVTVPIGSRKTGTVTITAKSANGKKGTCRITVYDPYKPVSVALAETGTLTVWKGETLTLTPAVRYTMEESEVPELYRASLTWSTSNRRFATVTDGTVSGVQEGTVTITVKTSNGKKAAVKVKVIDRYKPVSLSLEETGTAEVQLGETLDLHAAVTYYCEQTEPGAEIPEEKRTSLTWSTSNRRVATVSGGTVSGVKEGTATITVKTSNGLKKTIKVKVVDRYKATGVSLSTSTLTLNKGDTYQLTASLQPETARGSMTWSSSAAGTVSVENGMLTAKAEGTAVITVKTYNGKTAVCKVTVVDPYKPVSVSLDKTSAAAEVGDMITLTASVVYGMESVPEAQKTQLTWTSSKVSVATVDQNGIVTAVGTGSATITVKTANGKTASCKLTVSQGVPTINVTYRGVSTHGINFGSNFTRYVSYEAFKTLRDDYGVNTVRVAMYTEEYGGYCNGGSQKNLKATIDEAVQYATELGMYVIIDWHTLSDNNPNTNLSDAKVFWNEISAKYSDHTNVLYEICNEPNGGTTWAQVKSYAEQILAVIRKNDTHATVLVGTPQWCQRPDQVIGNEIDDDNVMYTVHFYASTHGSSIRDNVVKALKAGLKIFISECSICDASGSGSINYDSANAWAELVNKYNLGIVTWQLSNKNETSSLIKSSCSKLSGWLYDELSACGQWFLTAFAKGAGQ